METKSNVFYHGDCLFVMRHDIAPESVDLIYLDPPFFTGKVQKGTLKATQWRPEAMEVSYDDSRRFWDEKGLHANAPLWLKGIADKRAEFAAYLWYMMVRLEACRNVLKPTGSIYLHCDEKASHFLKMIMDEIFGYDNYRNEIVWNYGGRGGKAIANKYAKNHDVILYYTKSLSYTFNRQYVTRRYTPDEARAKGFRQDRMGWFKTAPRGNYTDASIAELRNANRIYDTENGSIRIRYDLEVVDGLVTEAQFVGDTWSDIGDAMHIGKESVGYPTQKPVALLRRIVAASSREGDVVLDPFCGCGATVMAATDPELQRRFIGVDISRQAIDVTRARPTQDDLWRLKAIGDAHCISRDLEEVQKLAPHQFHDWVNEYYGAMKPSQDRGIDGITREGIPIQTKAIVTPVKYNLIDAFSANVKHHPSLDGKTIQRAYFVSQSGFDDSARQWQDKIKRVDDLDIALLTPADMLDVEKACQQ